ncbi:rabphilin-3A-like isoform X2 [Xenopus laevis]|uniref:Rabphilin-3A-like isoform X2 n=1 Tax=Xenopus laevis TaxID=8355 RepID=A0A8J1MCY5_XENLA|nr:rabphilin-3A-like isoform X2 [Xenopus laevis]
MARAGDVLQGLRLAMSGHEGDRIRRELIALLGSVRSTEGSAAVGESSGRPQRRTRPPDRLSPAAGGRMRRRRSASVETGPHGSRAAGRGGRGAAGRVGGSGTRRNPGRRGASIDRNRATRESRSRSRQHGRSRERDTDRDTAGRSAAQQQGASRGPGVGTFLATGTNGGRGRPSFPGASVAARDVRLGELVRSSVAESTWTSYVQEIKLAEQQVCALLKQLLKIIGHGLGP